MVIVCGVLTGLNKGAFSGCSGIESLVVATGNKKYHSANNCIIETETKKLIVGCKTSIIPSDGSVTSIGDGAINSERDFRKTRQKRPNKIENSLQMIA